MQNFKYQLKYIIFLITIVCPGKTTANSQERPLSVILEEIGEKYQVFFTYNSKQLNKVKVDFKTKEKEDVTIAINRLLNKTKFSYKSFGEKYYVIYEKTKENDPNLKKIFYHLGELEKIESEGIEIKKKNSSNKKESNTQEETFIEGTVNDARGNPLIGTTVLVKGTSIGAIVDFDGFFKIKIPENATTLVFSYLGFKTKEVEIKSSNDFNIILEEEADHLEEIVVVGYGTTKRKELSGAIASIYAEDIENAPVQSFDKAVQGRVPGVQVVSSGAPGSAAQIRIRGVGSINSGNEPLYIIDGVQVLSGQVSEVNTQDNVLSTINPNDIISIDILKDASASIYGAQAANGVVIITTKRGKIGEPQFNFSAQWGIHKVINRLDLLTGPEWTELVLEGYANRFGITSSQYQNQLNNLGKPENAKNYDWQDLLFQEGFMSNYQLSARGGSEKSRYFISGSYNNTEGHVIGTGFERGTLRINLDNNFNERIKTSLSTNLSITKNDATTDDGFFFNNPTVASAFIVPTNAPYNENGSVREPLFGLFDENPLVNENPDLYDESSVTYKILTSFTLDYKLFKDAKFKSVWGFDFLSNNYNFFGSPEAKVSASTKGRIYKSNNRITNWQTDQIFSYNAAFRDIHRLETLVGVTYRQQKTNYFFTSGENLILPNLTSLENAITPNQTGGFDAEWRLAGFFGRLNYTFDDKYILTASIRRDGSSRFGKNNRWGWFPSISAAWRLSSESFMKEIDKTVNDLKIRASYGITGNANIGNFASRGLFTPNTYNTSGGLTPLTIDNPNLSWEQSETFNIGMDTQLFNKRITFTIDYFIRKTKDLILARPIPETTGYASITENIGALENKGLEISLNTTNIETRNFSWNTNFNIATVKNEITALTDQVNQITNNNSGTINRVGESLDSWYAIRWAGVNPADGRPLYYDKNGQLTFNPTEDDRVIIGSSIPTFTGGLTNTFSYNNFNIFAFFQYSGGNYLRNRLAFSTKASGGFGDRNQQRSELDRWQKPGDITDVPIAINGFAYDARPGNEYSSKHIEKGDYIRLKEVKISYDFPDILIEKLNLTNMSIYLSGSNLWTKTPYTGRDPEILGGDETGDYPQSKSYLLGINLEF